LNIGRRNIETDEQTKRFDRRMSVDAFDLFACILADRINFRPPFSAAFTLWASTIAQVGLASRPSCSRTST
jgi:hypothetical protein